MNLTTALNSVPEPPGVALAAVVLLGGREREGEGGEALVARVVVKVRAFLQPREPGRRRRTPHLGRRQSGGRFNHGATQSGSICYCMLSLHIAHGG